jgi:hypothetical protein
VEGLPLAADSDPLDKIRELEEQVGASLYDRLCLIDLYVLISHPHEKTEVTAGERITLSFPIAQSPSATF